MAAIQSLAISAVVADIGQTQTPATSTTTNSSPPDGQSSTTSVATDNTAHAAAVAQGAVLSLGAPLSLTLQPNQTLQEGNTTLDLSGTGSAPPLAVVDSPNGIQSATITWENGGPTENLTVFDTGGGTYLLGGVHTYANDGPASYTFTVTIVDNDGDSVQDSRTVTVNNVPPTLTISGLPSVDEGSVYTLGLSSSDPGADTISQWTIHWGDGTPAQIVAGNPSSVTHVYADGPNNYTISATATDEDGAYAAGNTVDVTVNNVSPALNLQPDQALYEGNTTLDLSGTGARFGGRRHLSERHPIGNHHLGRWQHRQPHGLRCNRRALPAGRHSFLRQRRTGYLHVHRHSDRQRWRSRPGQSDRHRQQRSAHAQHQRPDQHR